MDELKSALARVIDVRMLAEHLSERWRTDETAARVALTDAVTTLRAAEREITARLKIGPGLCRSESTIDGDFLRCTLDVGHDGAHQDGDWGWAAEPRYAPPAAAGPESKLSPCQVATRDLPCP